MKRKLTQDFTVDGEPMLMPDAGVELVSEDLDGESARDESGYYHRCVWRHDVKKWKFAYAVVTAEEYAYIKQLFQGKTTFQFGFTDEGGNRQTAKAYCMQTSVSWWSARRGIYKNLQFEVIEC